MDFEQASISNLIYNDSWDLDSLRNVFGENSCCTPSNLGTSLLILIITGFGNQSLIVRKFLQWYIIIWIKTVPKWIIGLAGKFCGKFMLPWALNIFFGSCLEEDCPPPSIFKKFSLDPASLESFAALVLRR